MQKIKLNFQGYCYPDVERIPEKPGIYCIYITAKNTIGSRNVTKLIYIGQAGSGDNSTLRSRISSHASTDYPAKRKYAYSFVEVPKEKLDLVEAALVFQFHPAYNKNLIKKYEYESVDVMIKGACEGLEDFILYEGTERF